MNLAEGFDSKYRFVLVAARRARQLLSGARPQVETGARKPCKIAMEELAAGKVKWNVPEPERRPVEVASEMLDKAMAAPAED